MKCGSASVTHLLDFKIERDWTNFETLSKRSYHKIYTVVCVFRMLFYSRIDPKQNRIDSYTTLCMFVCIEHRYSIQFCYIALSLSLSFSQSHFMHILSSMIVTFLFLSFIQLTLFIRWSIEKDKKIFTLLITVFYCTFVQPHFVLSVRSRQQRKRQFFCQCMMGIHKCHYSLSSSPFFTLLCFPDFFPTNAEPKHRNVFALEFIALPSTGNKSLNSVSLLSILLRQCVQQFSIFTLNIPSLMFRLCVLRYKSIQFACIHAKSLRLHRPSIHRTAKKHIFIRKCTQACIMKETRTFVDWLLVSHIYFVYSFVCWVYAAFDVCVRVRVWAQDFYCMIHLDTI